MDAIARTVVVLPESGGRIGPELAWLMETAREVRGVRACRELLRENAIACCLIPDAEADERGREIARWIALDGSDTQLICLVSPGSVWGREVIPTFRCDILEQGCPPNVLRSVIESAHDRAELRAQVRALTAAVRRPPARIIGTSAASTAWRESIEAAAAHGGPVLICGEPGSGKTLTAREIHRCGDTAAFPFHAIDCSLHTAETLDAELQARSAGRLGTPAVNTGGRAWGWEPGSRSDAQAGGTLVLENVECVPASYQKQLVQQIETPRMLSQSLASDPSPMRVFASTQLRSIQVDLHAELVRVLSQTVIHVPPLRERRQDLAALAEDFLQEIALRSGQLPHVLSSESVGLLENHVWQRNAAELFGLLECVTQATVDTVIETSDLAPWLGEDLSGRGRLDQGLTLKQMERLLIEATFARCAGNRERTAQQLGIGLRTLSGKLRAYGYPPRGGPGSNRQRHQLRVA